MFDMYKEGLMRAGTTMPMILQVAKARRQEREIQEKNSDVQSTSNGINCNISTGNIYHI